MVASLLLQAFLVFVLMVVPREIDRLRPYAPPRLQPDEVIYYSADELPRTEDLGGAQSGATGRAGGHEAHHRTQTIKVARGASLAQKVVDAPNLKLPSSPGAVANLLAFKSVPGPPPAEGLHSSLTAPSLPRQRDCSRARQRRPRSIPQHPHFRIRRAPCSQCFSRPISHCARSECGDRRSRSQRGIRAHALRAQARFQHHRPSSECLCRPHPRRALFELNRDSPRVRACFPRSGTLRSRSQRQRDRSRAFLRHPRSFSLARADEQCRRRASARLRARTRILAHRKTQPARAFRRRASTFCGFAPRLSPPRKRRRPFLRAQRGSSSAHASRERILRQQHHRQTLRHTGCCPATALGFFNKRRWHIPQLRRRIG